MLRGNGNINKSTLKGPDGSRSPNSKVMGGNSVVGSFDADNDNSKTFKGAYVQWNDSDVTYSSGNINSLKAYIVSDINNCQY